MSAVRVRFSASMSSWWWWRRRLRPVRGCPREWLTHWLLLRQIRPRWKRPPRLWKTGGFHGTLRIFRAVRGNERVFYGRRCEPACRVCSTNYYPLPEQITVYCTDLRNRTYDNNIIILIIDNVNNTRMTGAVIEHRCRYGSKNVDRGVKI